MPTVVNDVNVSGLLSYAGCGTGTLDSNASALIENSIIADNSFIFISPQIVIGTLGFIHPTSIEPGFATIVSTNPLDRSTFVYFILSPID